MKKFILGFILLAAIISACENKTKNIGNQDQSQINNDEITFVELKDFESQAPDLVGKKVKLTGTVDHVCQHGGQKMFIVNKDADKRIKILIGENMAAFNTNLVGETLAVVGVVDELRIDEEYLREWEEGLVSNTPPEQENPAMHAKEKNGQQVKESEHHEEEQNPEMVQINNLRQQLAESGKEYLSYFSIICVDYEVIEQSSEEEPAA